jgi:hydroxypyruvate reductase
VSLPALQETIRLLLRCGAEIEQINTVRKHLSAVGGGRLAVAAAPARVLALVVSDVVGDDASVIASGPTVPDPTRFADAREVLGRYGLNGAVPSSVLAHLAGGDGGAATETPKPGDPVFERTATHLVGRNEDALRGASAEAERRGYAPRVVGRGQTGEARDVGTALAAYALRAETGRATCLLWGGETTVTVRGTGRGGRNTELALSAALAMQGAPRRIALLSGGTDGIDGPTDAAGAVVTPSTRTAALERGYDAAAFLENNDAYTFFSRAGGLIVTGPTHTNVMDLQVALLVP